MEMIGDRAFGAAEDFGHFSKRASPFITIGKQRPFVAIEIFKEIRKKNPAFENSLLLAVFPKDISYFLRFPIVDSLTAFEPVFYQILRNLRYPCAGVLIIPEFARLFIDLQISILHGVLDVCPLGKITISQPVQNFSRLLINLFKGGHTALRQLKNQLA